MSAEARAEAFDHLKIAVREKPLEDAERPNVQVMLRSDEDKLVAFYPDSKEGLVYNYDYFFPEETTQVDVFQTVGAEMVELVLGGYSATCIGLGPSASGKTHTMFGSTQEPGLIQLTTKELFHRIERATERHYTVRFAYWEMSTESICDAIGPNDAPLVLKKSAVYGATVVSGLQEVEVGSWEQLDELLMKGNINRIQQAEARKARWHGFVRLFIDSTPTASPDTKTSCMLTFVHTKGPDRVGQKGVRGDALRNGSNINKSVSLLGSAVLHAVDYRRRGMKEAGQDEAKRRQVVESSKSFFMECKFTQLLAHAMCGDEATYLLAGVSTLDYHDTTDTLETLQNAQQLTARPRRRTVRTEHGKTRRELSAVESEAPKTALAEGHPLTEVEERVEQLRAQLGGKAVPKQEAPRRDVLPPIVPTGVQQWKQSVVKGKLHGDRATVYVPTAKGTKNTYQGQWAHGKREGQGMHVTPTTRYEGEWADGVRDGTGTLWTRTSEAADWVRVYRGEWRGGKRHGRGVQWAANGDIYDGYFDADDRSTIGKLFLANGDRVEGQFHANEIHGWATLYCKNNDRFEGFWVGGMREGPGVWYYEVRQQRYHGEWHKNVPKFGVIQDMEAKVTDEATGFLPRCGVVDPAAIIDQQRRRLDEQRELDGIVAVAPDADVPENVSW